MINRRTFTLFSMCAAAGVSGLANAQAAKKPKILVVYFSKTNHTKNIADTIARLTGADELRVEVVKPYPEAYRPTTQIVKEELEKGIVREIKAPEVDLSKYDVIIFGTPTWWHTWLCRFKPGSKLIRCKAKQLLRTTPTVAAEQCIHVKTLKHCSKATNCFRTSRFSGRQTMRHRQFRNG